jgi:HEAT repeat protein
MSFTKPMLLFAATSLATSVATSLPAQQSGRSPVPPVQPAPRPAPAAAPAQAARPVSPDRWELEAEREARSSLRSIDESLRELSVISGQGYAPRALMALEANAAAQSVLAADIGRLNAEAIAMRVEGQLARAGFPMNMDAPMAMSVGGSYRTTPPASWDPQDAADSLYREARRALGNDNYQIAAQHFKRIRDQYPKSTYTPDAYYWEAFALQRMGQRAQLSSALELLAMQQEKFPRASTRGDAATLKTRIEGQLARMGDQQAIASLADKARNATSDGCPREQDDERIDALNALSQMDAEQAMPILKQVLARREPCTQRLRRQAVWLVASRKQPDAAAILLNVAKTDPDKDVREQAVFWMANVPTEEATTMLIDLAKKGDDLDMRKRAVYALSRSKSPRAATTLREIVLDVNTDASLRGDALSWYLSGPGRASDDAFAFLKDVYGRADDARFQQRVLQLMASRRTDESRAFLSDVAQNPKESMENRRSALWALQGAGVTTAQLAQIYDRGTEVELRKQVISMLSAYKENAGVDKLLDIARNEKNVELRKQAISALSRTKDPRALALMQEIILK